MKQIIKFIPLTCCLMLFTCALGVQNMNANSCSDYQYDGVFGIEQTESNNINSSYLGGEPCYDIEAHVFLEGPLTDPASAGEYLSEMRTDLNTFRVLPGQTYFSFLFGLNYTEPGQPFAQEPWNYFGSEGEGFDSEGNMENSDAGYPSTVVDWVLLSLRPGSSPSSPAVWRSAALLHQHGSIELLQPVPCCVINEEETYYLQIQHRNHLLVMSHQPIEFVNGVLSYDFRTQDSYIFDLFGFGAVGQNEVESGVFAMFAGDGDQSIAVQSQIEINFNDKQRFDEDLGEQQQYSIGDYNMDGNTQFNDKLVLIENLGSQSSVDPVTTVVTSEADVDCETAEVFGELIEGVVAEEVWIELDYTGGCGEFGAQEVSSIGVIGLTASLSAGVFGEEGSLMIEISGIPDTSGTAIFELEIGGQSCLLEVGVLSLGPDYPEGTVHCDPDDPTLVMDVINPITGRTWMDRNLGASQMAESSADSLAYGDLYQWGRFADGHQCRSSDNYDGVVLGRATTAEPNAGNGWDGQFIFTSSSPFDWLTPPDDDLWQGVYGENNPCPVGYRLPTEAEWDDERSSWSSNNAAGAFDSALKLPAAGERSNSSGSFTQVGNFGRYWSSTKFASDNRIRALSFSGSSTSIFLRHRAYGFSVRCIKDQTYSQGVIEILECESAILNGVLIEDEQAEGVSIEVPYSGGNGGVHDGQIVNSTGVTGLTATLAAGNFETGGGTLTYEITGTADTSGIAIFELEIGGESCELEIEVAEQVEPIAPGTIFFGQQASSSSGGFSQQRIYQIDEDLNLVNAINMNTEYGVPGGLVRAISVHPDGYLAFRGSAGSISGGVNMRVLRKTDFDGETVWTSYPQGVSATMNTVQFFRDGSVACVWGSSNQRRHDAETGDVLWTYSTSGSAARGVSTDLHDANSYGNTNGWVFKVDGEGDQIWGYTNSGSSSNVLCSAMDPVTGDLYYGNNGGALRKMDSTGVEVAIFTDGGSGLQTVEVGPEAVYIYTSGDNTIRRLNKDNLTEEWAVDGIGEPGFALTPTGYIIALSTGGNNANLLKIDITNGNIVQSRTASEVLDRPRETIVQMGVSAGRYSTFPENW